MGSKFRLSMAAVVATIIGLPLAERSQAASSDAWDITNAALGLAAAITSAAIGLS
jgi:hypothetical protein